MKKVIGLVAILAMSSQSALAIGPLISGIHPDISVVGPGGEVIIYYKDGNDIVVKNCGTNYPVIKNRSDCQGGGPENRVPVSVFKHALASEFLLSDADKLKPLTPAEAKAYRQHDSGKVDALTQQKQVLDAKMARIQAFIQQYGADSKTSQDQANTQNFLMMFEDNLQVSQAAELLSKRSMRSSTI